jgi:hypothetical protein
LKQIRNRLTYANVMSSLAVFLIIGGATAFAAVKKIGANEIKANSIKTGKIVKEAVTAGKLKNGAVTESKLADGAVTTSKIADNAVTTPKIANDAVTNGKIANEAVSTGKLANSGVTAGKLAQSERSEAFQNEIAGSSEELPESLGDPTLTIVTLSLPAGGTYVVTAQTELIRTIGEPVFTECFLNDGGTGIAEMSDTYQAGLFFPSGGVTMTGVSDGGTVALACKSTDEDTFAFHRKIVAVRVGSVTG